MRRDVVKHDGLKYVLSSDQLTGFVGLEAFLGRERVGEIFLRDEEEVGRVLGGDGIYMKPEMIVKKLADCIEY